MHSPLYLHFLSLPIDLHKNKAGGLTLSDFKTYHQAIVVKTLVFGERMDIWINGTE